MITDYQMIERLKSFKVKNVHSLDIEEMNEIHKKLQLQERDVLSLRNLRNFVCVYFDLQKETHKENDRFEYIDKMMAITGCIDDRLFDLGALN